MARNELTELELAEALAADKRLYEAEHPETRRGGYIRDRDDDHNAHAARYDPPPYTEAAAKDFGISPATVRRSVQIAERIPEEVREQIRESPLADRKAALLALARMPEEEQREVGVKVANGEITTLKELEHTRTASPPACRRGPGRPACRAMARSREVAE